MTQEFDKRRKPTRLRERDYLELTQQYPEIDCSKHRLGRLCPKGHDWNGTGMSLRYRSKGGCCRCQYTRTQLSAKEYIELTRQYPEIDYSKYRLGKLCKRGHDWNGTGMSLRKLHNGGCCACRQQGDKTKLQRRKTKVVAVAEVFAALTQDLAEQIDRTKHFLGYPCVRGHRWRDTEFTLRYFGQGQCVICVREDSKRRYDPERSARISKAWRAKNRERVRQNREQWRTRNPDKVKWYRRRDQVRHRTIRKQAKRIPYTAQQLQQRWQEFDNTCAYCGVSENLTVDHFVPLSKGGIDAISNIIPACHSCNSRKSASDAHGWYLNTPFYSLERWNRICEVLRASEH